MYAVAADDVRRISLIHLTVFAVLVFGVILLEDLFALPFIGMVALAAPLGVLFPFVVDFLATPGMEPTSLRADELPPLYPLTTARRHEPVRLGVIAAFAFAFFAVLVWSWTKDGDPWQLALAALMLYGGLTVGHDLWRLMRQRGETGERDGV